MWIARTMFGMAVLIAAILLGDPSPGVVGIGFVASLWVILGISYQVTFGLAGQFSVGHAMPYGVGAYVIAIAMTNSSMSFWVALLLAVGAGGLAGALLGAPGWRLERDYVALVTLAFGLVFQQVALNWGEVTGGSRGIAGIPRIRLGSAALSDRGYLIVGVVVATAVLLFAEATKRSALGRSWVALRDDELAARAMGVRTRPLKIMAFVAGGALAAVAGGLFASYQSFVSSVSFGVIQSVQVLLIALLAGLGRLYATVFVAAALTVLTTSLSQYADVSLAVLGAAILAVMLWRFSGARQIVQGWLRRSGDGLSLPADHSETAASLGETFE